MLQKAKPAKRNKRMKQQVMQRAGTVFIIFIFFFISLRVHAQESTVTSPFTTGDFRRQFYDGLMKWSIWNNLSYPLTDADNAYDFSSSFWPMELILYRSDSAKQRIAYAFSRIEEQDTGFQRGLLELVYTLYPDDFRSQVTALMQRASTPKILAMCAEYLWQNGRYPQVLPTVEKLMHQRFDTLQNDPVLLMMKERMFRKAPMPPMPPLSDLLSEQFAPGLTVLYSFQRSNRDVPGLVLVRQPDGHFVRDSNNKIIAVPQLARAINNLPFYLTNGNTPQGIYRMSGFGVSSSRFIGPTQNIQLSMPYEIPVDSFVVSYAGADSIWRIEDYKNLLPSSWQSYTPIYHAYYAGEAGRTAIIAHGTTIDPEYYKGQPYYPQTPSLGCLCALETWSPVNGMRLSSNQQRLVDAVKTAGLNIGYAVVIELNEKEGPIQMPEILSAIREAESRLQ